MIVNCKCRARTVAILFFILLCKVVPAQGFLRAKGHDIVNEKGEKVILQGMGLGGWMLQEGYMYQLGFLGQQYRIREKIAASVGEQKAAQFYEEWLQKHTTGKDIALLASFGFNSIRLPMHYALYTLPAEQEPVKGQQTWIEKGFALTDSLLAWCRDNKMYLVLDLHAAPGGQGNDLAISDRDPAKPSLWQSEANQQKTIALWKKLAARYANEPWIGGYDIINEPNWGFQDTADKRGIQERLNAPLRKLMQEITQAIREVDQKHIIIIEGNGFGNNYHGVLPPWDDNMVLSFHKYGNFNTKEAIQYFLSLREQYNMPLWLGESGENFNTWFTEAIKLAEEEGIGWAWWQHKKMGINNPLEIKKPEGYDKLVADWSGKGPKVAAAEAWHILQEWLHNTTAAQNIIHQDVVDAMFRQVREQKAIPFRRHVLKDRLTVQAVDFDLGPQRIAYYDKDTASYHYTPGVNTTGNKGRTYRNDGVDIRRGGEGPYIFSTEDGEWMQYTVDAAARGTYKLSVRTASEKNGAAISVLIGDRLIASVKELPATGAGKWADISAGTITLEKGSQPVRLRIDKGGADILSFTITKAE